MDRRGRVAHCTKKIALQQAKAGTPEARRRFDKRDDFGILLVLWRGRMAKKLQQRQKKFCTECGTDLDDFWLTQGAGNYEETLKHHLECQREGRFKGSMCAKLYIVDGGMPDTSNAAPPVSPRKRASLKKSIMSKIEKEEKKNGAR
jgi:hypothetical protein